GERRREALIALLAAWAVSIYQQPATEPLFLAWLFILPVAILSPSGRGAFWYLPWLAVLATVVGWLGFAAKASGEFLLVTLAEEHHGMFLTYLMLAAVATLMSGLWQWRHQLQLRRWASLVMLAPVIWLLLGWLLDRKSTRLNSSHVKISYAVFCLKKKKACNTTSSNSA